MWESLVANLATVALVVLGWNQAQPCLGRLTRVARNALFAAAMGGGAVASMMLAIRLEQGVIFDLRSSLIALAGFFGGLPGALIAGGVAAAYRLALGGQGVWAGLFGIACAGGVGTVAHALLRRRKPAFAHILLFAAGVSASTVLSFWALPAEIRMVALFDFGVEISLLNFAATAAGALAIFQMMELAGERELLRAALAQAPDFQFVKNRRGEFVAVNETVADHNGFRSPAAMRGRTDFDITLPGRAQRLWDDEREVLRTGAPLVNLEERITQVNGATRWFSTSKAALRDSDGQVIGLAGVTRDITEQKQAEASLASGQNQFKGALEDVSDGVALFNGEGWLLYSNRRFRECLRPQVGPDGGKPDWAGLNAADVFGFLEGAVPPAVEGAEIVGSVRSRPADLLFGGGAVDCQTPNFRWLRIRFLPERGPERSGVLVVLVTDVTHEKEAGRMLEAFTASLGAMDGAIDGLPSPSACRAFRRDVEAALAQAAALQRALSAG